MCLSFNGLRSTPKSNHKKTAYSDKLLGIAAAKDNSIFVLYSGGKAILAFGLSGLVPGED